MKRTRLRIAKPDIIKLFEQHDHRVFRRSDINQILVENRAFWRLAQSETLWSFLDFLLKATKLRRVQLKFPSRPETRYIWGDAPLYQLLQHLKPNAYFSHYTAIFVHDLSDQIPRTIYLNDEQSPKPKSAAALTQERIDAAFRRSPRKSSNIVEFSRHRICLLSGKQTGKLGVISATAPDDSKVRVTDIERTLIDSAVRSYYAGGVQEVLLAFKRAEDRLSVNRLSAYLAKLDYVYPYHQAIGFYLERAGNYTASQIRLLSRRPMEFNFYLTYQIADPKYSDKWRLFFPQGL